MLSNFQPLLGLQLEEVIMNEIKCDSCYEAVSCSVDTPRIDSLDTI